MTVDGDDASGAPGERGAAGAGGVLRRVLGRLAAAAPARVFVIAGANAPDALDALRLDDEVRFVDSPRSASLLLVAGELPEALYDAARRIHDQLAHPRRVVRWEGRTPAPLAAALFPLARVVAEGEDVASALRATQASLLAGRVLSDRALLPDTDPAPWRGVGPYGQGGTGMTGGVPYGRPMTDRAPDRDGLELDQLPVRVGPFFAPFPVGLVLVAKVQGDIVQEVAVQPNPFPTPPSATALAHDAMPSLATIERARARHHLLWLAHALHVQGLTMLARRARRLALALDGSAATDAMVRRDLDALHAQLRRTRALPWATRDVGVIPAELVRGRNLGPIARASGVAEDARLGDAAYASLGFEPIVQEAGAKGDVWARWRQRAEEASQSLRLAAAAGGRGLFAGAVVEGPRGPLGAEPAAVEALLALIPQFLAGTEWGDAVTTLVSIDLDLRPGAAARFVAGAPGAATLRAEGR